MDLFLESKLSADIVYSDYGLPYENQHQLMEDFFILLDVSLYYFYKHHQWVGPDNNMQNLLGVVVTKQEFEMNLQRSSESIIGANWEKATLADIGSIEDYFDSRIDATKKSEVKIRILTVSNKFFLKGFSEKCLLLAFATAIDKKYQKIFAYLQDDINLDFPLASTAVKLFAEVGKLTWDYYDYFDSKSSMMKFLFQNNGVFGLDSKIVLSNRIVNYLLFSQKKYASETVFPSNEAFIYIKEIEHPMYVEDESSKLLDIIMCANDKEIEKTNNSIMIFISGIKGGGKSFRVSHAVKKANKKLIFCDLKLAIEAEGNMRDVITSVLRESIFLDGIICFTNFQHIIHEDRKKELCSFIANIMENKEFLGSKFFITSDEKWQEDIRYHNFIRTDVEVTKPTEEERIVYWESFSPNIEFADDVDFEEIASKFLFTPLQIKKSIEQMKNIRFVNQNKLMDTKQLHLCCYEQAVMKLSTLATLIKPDYSFNDLVLPKEQEQELREVCSHVKYKHTVYSTWGFSKKVKYGKGLSMLFAGSPGTGKTMAAQIVANYLHMNIYKIQLSQVVSKYIGETEKNLRRIFTEASEANVILFFDETDALFGKRSEVKDSHDRHANIETAYLLQQMEEYEGVIIMATNLLQNIDEAFMRRIGFVINFPFPDEKTREKLWRKMLQVDAPIDENVDYEFLAKHFKIPGGNIKNIVVHAAFLAAGAKQGISMEFILKSAVRELRKSNIVVVKEDLKEYANLVFK